MSEPFKYETHCHTSEASRCGRMSGAAVAEFYASLGYTGIFTTDHFFNGSSNVPKDLSWEEKIAVFLSGYSAAKRRGEELGLDVFFGIEYNYGQTEFLIYGADEAFLLAHPDCDRMEMRDFLTLCHENALFCVQAHPFRQRGYIKCLRLYPDITDAVECVNAAHPLAPDGSVPFDERARWYASSYSLPVTGGSDCHIPNMAMMGGIYTEERIHGWQDYARLVTDRRVTPFRSPHISGGKPK